MKSQHKTLCLLVAIIMLISISASCATPAAPVSPNSSQASASSEPAKATSSSSQPTKAPAAAATPVPPTAAPKVGGKVVTAQAIEPTTMDIQVGAAGAGGTNLVRMINATLVSVDPNTGKYVPYLAESWEVSPDGITYTFKLKKGVKFHNGEPLLAKDWVYTVQRAQDPAVKAVRAILSYDQVAKVEAVDDYTVRFTLKQPYALFLFWLSHQSGVSAPVSKVAIDKWGANYGRHPVGVGPYIFQEWQAGKKIVMVRNPDFNWGPAWAAPGTPSIETLEFALIPEEATRVAGMEAGELQIAQLPGRLKSRFEDKSRYALIENLASGTSASFVFDLTKPPFSDLKVRQALSYAVEKEALVKLVAPGAAKPQSGPLSPIDIGYWSGVEEIAYKPDVAKAKSLLKEAGWNDTNGDGILEKDGKPLAFAIKISSANSGHVRSSEILKEQFKSIGLDVSIKQLEAATFAQEVTRDGNFEAAIASGSLGEADLMVLMFTPDGGYKYAQPNDPTLLGLLRDSRSTLDPAKRQEILNQAQKLIVQNAYSIPLYNETQMIVYSPKIKGLVVSKFGEVQFNYWFYNAYLSP